MKNNFVYIRIAKDCDPVALPSEAWIDIPVNDSTAGVPEMVPLCESSNNPSGSFPEMIVQVKGAKLPWAWKVRVNGVPTTPCIELFDVIVITSAGGGGDGEPGGEGVDADDPPPHPQMLSAEMNSRAAE